MKGIMEDLNNGILGILWGIEYETILPLRCFFKGHSIIVPGAISYEAPYCKHCLHEEPEENTLPDRLCAGYVWLMDRDNKIINAIDEWLWENIPHRFFPHWWKY